MTKATVGAISELMLSLINYHHYQIRHQNN